MNKITFVIFSASFCAMALTNCSKVQKGIDEANLDPTVSPTEDFYQYACGGWMKDNPLTGEYSRYGTFDQLGELNRQQVHDLIIGIKRGEVEEGSNAQKIADLYALGMDSVKLNEDGAAPVATDIEKINSLEKDDLFKNLATLTGNAAFFNSGVGADMADASMNTMYLEQGGLGLGDRDYYLKDGENEKTVLEAYKKYLNTLATLAGYSD